MPVTWVLAGMTDLSRREPIGHFKTLRATISLQLDSRNCCGQPARRYVFCEVLSYG